MALAHFKRELELEARLGRGECGAGVGGAGGRGCCSDLTNPTITHCSGARPTVMLGGVDLGLVLRMTVQRELNLIKEEAVSEQLRASGS